MHILCDMVQEDMEDPMETSQSAEPLDLVNIRSRLIELRDTYRSCKDGDFEISHSESDRLLIDCALAFDSNSKQIVKEYCEVGFLGTEDLDSYLEHLKEELYNVEAESVKISEEIELLTRTNAEDSNKLESDLESLLWSLDTYQVLEKATVDPDVSCSTHVEGQSNLNLAHRDQTMEILRLDSQIEKNQTVLKTLQDLDSMFKRFDVVEQIEDALAGLKVIDFDATNIRLSLTTYIPKIENMFFQQNFEVPAESSELNHELLIEIIDGKIEVKNVEMLPNDIYIGDIIEAAKSLSFRQLSSQLVALDTRSSLGWFVGKVQDRIILSTMRRYVVKSASSSRHSFDYLDRDETIVAHLIGGVDAFIKVPQSWPMSNSPLKLVSVRSADHSSNGVSLSLLCKAEEMANSMDIQTRQNLSIFVDAVEKMLVEQMRSEISSNVANQN